MIFLFFSFEYKSVFISFPNCDSTIMMRCHQCGKVLHEIPFRCHRCGKIFCADHHLPENHHCSTHHHTHQKSHHKYCGNCGKELSGLPFRCHRCGRILCDDCRLPENHRCKFAYSSSNNSQSTPPRKNISPGKYWEKLKDNLTLKNFTIISILFIFTGYLSSITPLHDYQSTFQFIFGIGVLCFILAYFLYAVRCWGSDHQLGALLMVTVPILAYFMATSKIPDSTMNILFYIFIQFCFYAILSAILLYVSNKVRDGVEKYVFRKSARSYRYFYPQLSYSVIGVIFISFLLVNYGSTGIFSDNAATITQSFQKVNSPASTITLTTASPTFTYSQNSQIIPTLQPEVVKGIENTVGNSAPAIDISTLEMQIHNGINQQRKNNGLSALRYDSSLADVARKHSADMAKNNYFSHDNLQGLDPTGRGNQVGYSCYKNFGSYYMTGIAENIMQNNLYDSVTYYNGIPRYAWNSQEEIAQSTVSGWMDSPGHRQNILTSTYDREGIGVAIASDDKVYVTEDFC